jgi:hypothetical protein
LFARFHPSDNSPQSMPDTRVSVPQSALPMIHALGLIREHFQTNGNLDRATFEMLCSEAHLASQLAIAKAKDCAAITNPFLL